MAQLVIIVLAAVWVAVLIPPMLRSRVDNRPNSSVTDFRRQLNKLQSTATPARGSVRAMGRPLAQSWSPLQRQAAGGRPGQPPVRQSSPARQSAARQSAARQGSLRGTATATSQRTAPMRVDHGSDTNRYRSHGDPTSGQRRPQVRLDAGYHPVSRPTSPQHRQSGRPAARPSARPVDPAVSVKRRRMNVLFILVVTAACTMFLAATTQSTVMLWMFGLSFLALCGYIYVLAQLREQEDAGWNNGWLEQR